MTNILSLANYKCSVSSVLNKDVKQNGKKFMLDGMEDTAWSSDQGLPQRIVIEFETPQEISSFSFQFQGGFAGKDCTISINDETGLNIYKENFYPDDVNSVQNFKLKNTVHNAFKVTFVFETSTDFFGRIIVYKLEIYN